MASNPFPGARPYRATEEAVFPPRTEDERRITYAILAHRCLVLHGPSGAGKSSLLQAAILPKLWRENGTRTVSIDKWPPDSEGPLAKYLVGELFSQLGIGKVPSQKALAPGQEPPRADVDREHLRALVALAMERAERKARTPIVCYLDQIEQLLFPDRHREPVDDLLAIIDELVAQPRNELHVVLGIRDDHLSMFRDRARPSPRLLGNDARLGRLTVDEMIEAVESGAKSRGHTWERARVTSLVREMRLHPETTLPDDMAEVQAPYVQIVCRTLYEKETRGEKVATTSKEILDNYLDDTLLQLPVTVREKARSFLEDLLDKQGNRHPLTLREVESALPVINERQEVLKKLRERAVLRAEAHESTQLVELGHDLLAKKVWEWKKARAEQDAKDERVRAEREKLSKVALFVAGAVLLVLAGLTTWALVERHDADEQRAAAQLQAQVASGAALQARTASEDAIEQRRRADEAMLLIAARQMYDKRDMTAAAQLLLEVEQPSEAPRATSWSSLATAVLTHPMPRRVYRGHTADVERVFASRDGRSFLSQGKDNVAALWSVGTAGADSFVELRHSHQIEAAAWSHDGSRVATAAGERVLVWSKDGKRLTERTFPELVRTLGFRPDGALIVAQAKGVDALGPDGAALPRQPVWAGLDLALAYPRALSSSARRILSVGGSPAKVQVRDLESGNDTTLGEIEPFQLRSGWFDPSEKVVAVSTDEDLRIYDLAAPAAPAWKAQLRGLQDVQIADAEHVSVLTWEGVTRLERAGAGATRSSVLRVPPSSLRRRTLLSASVLLSRGTVVEEWSLTGFEPAASGATGLAVEGTDKVIADASDDGGVIVFCSLGPGGTEDQFRRCNLWRPPSSRAVPLESLDAALAVRVSGDGRRVLAIARGAVWLWGADQPERPPVKIPGIKRPLAADFGPRGDVLWILADDGAIRVVPSLDRPVPRSTKCMLAPWRGPDDISMDAAQQMIVAPGAEDLSACSVEGGKFLRTLDGSGVSFAPTGSLAFTWDNRHARLWDFSDVPAGGEPRELGQMLVDSGFGKVAAFDMQARRAFVGGPKKQLLVPIDHPEKAAPLFGAVFTGSPRRAGFNAAGDCVVMSDRDVTQVWCTSLSGETRLVQTVYATLLDVLPKTDKLLLHHPGRNLELRPIDRTLLTTGQEDLRRRLEQATSDCLPAATRAELLGESPGDAKKKSEACELRAARRRAPSP